MKALFLDVDGVLNSEQWFTSVTPTDDDYLGLRSLDPAAVRRLLRVLNATGAIVVLSSTWRLVDDYIITLQAAGIPISDITPRIASNNRGYEIASWFRLPDRHEIDKFAIVDDDADAGDHGLRPWLVQTKWECGLTDADADALIAMLS